MKPRVNGNEIRFFIDPKLEPGYIGLVLNQIANMIYGMYGPGVAIKKDDGYQYGLGYRLLSGKEYFPNDWWADIGAHGDEANEVVVAYRYGNCQVNSEKLPKFRDTIIWLLDLDRFNKEEIKKSEKK